MVVSSPLPHGEALRGERGVVRERTPCMSNRRKPGSTTATFSTFIIHRCSLKTVNSWLLDSLLMTAEPPNCLKHKTTIPQLQKLTLKTDSKKVRKQAKFQNVLKLLPIDDKLHPNICPPGNIYAGDQRSMLVLRLRHEPRGHAAGRQGHDFMVRAQNLKGLK